MTTSGALLVLEQGIGSHALQHNGLASHAQEWQRELDRAQARAWFHAASPAPNDVAAGPMDIGHPPHAAAVPAAPALAQVIGAAQGASLNARAGTADAPALSGAATTRRGIDADPPAPGLSVARPEDALATAPCCMRPTSSGAGAAVDAPRATPRRDPLPVPADAEIRMHVEPGGEGVRVWIGLDGDEAAVAARAATLLTQLRRALQAEGQRLLALTCNGRLVDEALSPSTTQEQTTWRSER